MPSDSVTFSFDFSVSFVVDCSVSSAASEALCFMNSDNMKSSISSFAISLFDLATSSFFAAALSRRFSSNTRMSCSCCALSSASRAVVSSVTYRLRVISTSRSWACCRVDDGGVSCLLRR